MEARYDLSSTTWGREMARLRVVVSPGCRRVAPLRPLTIGDPGGRVIAGRQAQLRLPHVSGAENEFLSGRALGVGLDQAGLPYLVNLSASHELIVRPWGLGTAAEWSVPPRGDEAELQPRYLGRGSFWVRNGRHWDARYARFGTPLGDDRTSWALIQVDDHDPLARLLLPRASEDAACDGSTIQVLDAPEEWDLTESQIRSALVYYSEFLAWPPRVTPHVLTEPEAESASQGLGGMSRLDHMVRSAKLRGFPGDRTDLLTWLVSNKLVTPAIIGPSTRDAALGELLFPVHGYRPLV